MNGFTKKNIGTLTLGEKLRKLRSDKRISLNEVARLTKIKVSYLECLEDGSYGKLPADVYAKGFLRSYADFLGVDEKILIKLYEKERGIQNNLEKKRKPGKEKKDPLKISYFVFTPKKIILAVVSGVILLGVIFLFREINSFASEPSLIILNPEDGLEVSEEVITIEGMTDKEAFLFINGQPILVGDEGNFKEDVVLQLGVNTINIKAVNKFQKEIQSSLLVKLKNENGEKSDLDYSNEGNSFSEKDSDIKLGEEFQIDLRVDPGPVWLNVEADGKAVFSGTMLSGAVQIFKAREKIVISSGRGDATFVKFNNQDIGALSAEPNPVRDVVYTKDFKK